MIRTTANPVGQQLETLWSTGTLTGLGDDQLLARFCAAKDEAAELAFRELMHRHGPMVMGVCRQILQRPHDADDAFQATFLVLVRKSGSIRVGDSLAPWLYSVAFRTAHRARAVASRYHPVPAENLEVPAEGSSTDACHFDLRPLLHEELNRLPDKYRDPIVLCHLEGKSHEEAARLLHWPVGTVSGRLSRGRELLRSRLERRGLELSPAALAATWSAGTSTAIAPFLIESTVGGAFGLAGSVISASVQSLVRKVLNAMFLSKIKLAAVAGVLAAGTATGAAVWGFQTQEETPQPAPQAKRDAPDHKNLSKPTIPKSVVGSPANTTVEETQVSLKRARNKNAPNVIDAHQPFPGFRFSTMVLVQSPDRSAWQALSLIKERPQSGTMDKVPYWTTLELPQGTTGEPVWSFGSGGGPKIVALALQGKTIDQIAAFNAEFGVWIKERLRQPVEEEINPVAVGGMVLYQAGNDFYALTERRLEFVVLHLEGAEPATASFTGVDLEVMQGNRLYVFSPVPGTWSSGIAVYQPPKSVSPKQNPEAGGKASQSQ
jgi:RNA polymerase sigma factor (sigma-70 family)